MRFGIVSTRIYVHVWVVVEGMHTCKTGNFGNEPFCVYVCVVVEDMYTYKTGNFGNGNLCLCLCCCRGYLEM